LLKTEGALFEKARRWGARAVLPMGLAFFAISIATPLVSPTIADKWFSLPNFIGLAPIPLSTVLAFGAIVWVLRQPHLGSTSYAWIVMAGTVLMCILAALGLAYSLYPYVILNRMTVWEAAAASESLRFVLFGVAIVMPFTLAYTVFVYRVFRGKATGLSYGDQPVAPSAIAGETDV
jgi:cytochrome d ubiquinol oxidase subunit II